MSLLIVDDNPAICDLLSALCEQAEIEHVVAANGKEALRACEERLFELVVTDINMPQMDGIELARELRHRFPDTHIYCHTGSRDFLDAAEEEKLFDRVFYKPTEHSRMIATAMKFLARNKLGVQ